MRAAPVGKPRRFTCVMCDKTGLDSGMGRPRIFCSTECRQFAHTERNRSRAREWYRANRARALANTRASEERIGRTELNRRRAVRRHAYYPTRETLKRYGLTRDEYDSMYRQQFGRCALCRRDRKLVIDHDHGTGRVRGLLCNPCNYALGALEDNFLTIMRAESYIRPLASWEVA